MTLTTTIETAIRESAESGEIIHVTNIDEPDYAIDDALACLADDSVRNGDIIEAWGTDDDGGDWRVHIRVA